MGTLLQMAKEKHYIQNLHWTPEPRMIVLTDNFLEDVVDSYNNQNISHH